MRNANLTRHAWERLGERCKLSPEKLKHLLDSGVTIPVALQKGGRHAKRLLYSSPDQDWFIVVQDASDGGILTVMPLQYLKHRIAVTASQKRSARCRVREFEKPRMTQPVRVTTSTACADVPPPGCDQRPAPTGWKIRVCYTVRGMTCYRNLPRTPVDHGSPTEWSTPGAVHGWFRERLIEAAIPFRSVEKISAERKGESVMADCLLEHLPLTPEEIAACR